MISNQCPEVFRIIPKKMILLKKIILPIGLNKCLYQEIKNLIFSFPIEKWEEGSAVFVAFFILVSLYQLNIFCREAIDQIDVFFGSIFF